MGRIKLYKFIDHWVGILVCFILGVLNHFFRKPQEACDVKNICIIKCFGIGSLILQQTLIYSLKNKFKNATITFITFKSNKKILELYGQCDEIFTIDSKNVFSIIYSLLTFIFFAKKKNFDVTIDLEFYSKFTTILTFFSFARRRLGFYLPSLWRKLNYDKMTYFNTSKHIQKSYQGFEHLLGIENEELCFPKIEVSRKWSQTLKSLPSEFNDEGYKLIGMNINASELVLGRRWEPEKFSELAHMILKKYAKSKIILTGAHDEKEYTNHCYQKLPATIKENTINLAGLLDFEDFLALLSRLDILITNDSGPLHMAFAVETPTFTIWGPGDPNMYGPAFGSHGYIYMERYCSPCMYIYRTEPGQFCDFKFTCLKDITPQMAFKKFSSFVEKEKIF